MMGRSIVSTIILLCAFSAFAENAYTNHAGNVVSGVVIALDARTVTISNATETAKLPLSIFPESEQRRIASDAGQPRIPVAVKRAIAGAEKAMARSRKRAEKGLCTKEESEAFCAKSETALKSYLDKQVKEGVITPAERKALRRAAEGHPAEIPPRSDRQRLLQPSLRRPGRLTSARRWRTSAPPPKRPPSATRKRPSSADSAGTAPASSAYRKGAPLWRRRYHFTCQ